MGKGDTLEAVPHEGDKRQQSEYLRDELLDISLYEVADKAASGQGDPNKIANQDYASHTSDAVNTSDKRVFARNGLGITVDMASGTRYYNRGSNMTEPFETEHGEATLSTDYEDNRVEFYTVDSNLSFRLETTTPDGRKIRYRVNFYEAKMVSIMSLSHVSQSGLMAGKCIETVRCRPEESLHLSDCLLSSMV